MHSKLTLELATNEEAEVDYSGLIALADSPSAIVGFNALIKRLRQKEIKTYGDLIEYARKNYETLPVKERYGVRDPFWIRNVGLRTLSHTYNFLNDRGIHLFETPYKPRELDANLIPKYSTVLRLRLEIKSSVSK